MFSSFMNSSISHHSIQVSQSEDPMGFTQEDFMPDFSEDQRAYALFRILFGVSRI